MAVKIIIQGNWAHYTGTDYCDALGIYNNLKDAQADADTYAWDRFEIDEEDDGEYYGEGPDYWLEEYDPEKHDMLKVGDGSFEEEFSKM